MARESRKSLALEQPQTCAGALEQETFSGLPGHPPKRLLAPCRFRSNPRIRGLYQCNRGRKYAHSNIGVSQVRVVAKKGGFGGCSLDPQTGTRVQKNGTTVPTTGTRIQKRNDSTQNWNEGTFGKTTLLQSRPYLFPLDDKPQKPPKDPSVLAIIQRSHP